MEKGAVDGGGGLSFSPGVKRTPESPLRSLNSLCLHLFDLIFPHSPYSVICIFQREGLGLRELQELPSTEDVSEYLISRPGA